MNNLLFFAKRDSDGQVMMKRIVTSCYMYCSRHLQSPDESSESWIYQDFVRQQMVLNDDDGGAKDWELFSPGRPRYHLSACLHAGVSID